MGLDTPVRANLPERARPHPVRRSAPPGILGEDGDQILRRAARVTALVTSGLLVVAAVALIARFLPTRNRSQLFMAALSPFLMTAGPAALVILIATSAHPGWIAVAAAVTVAALATQAPSYIRGRVPTGPTVRLVTANLRYGRSDPAAVLELAYRSADVLTVQELTPELADALSSAGIDTEFPHRVLRPRERAAGVGLWSRYPISRTDEDDGFERGFIAVAVRIPGTTADTTVVCTHMSPPRSAFHKWHADLARLGPALQRLGSEGPVIVGCDLNATPDVFEFRRLLTGGYRDGAAQAGAGLTRTHPDHAPVPRLLAVDHVLTRGATVTSMRLARVIGSDHLALVTTVVLNS